MTVTQVLMGAGSWQVRFAEQLPTSVRDQILPLDHIVIGPRGLLTTSETDGGRLSLVKESGGYCGVILEIPDLLSLSGQDLSWWLGDSEGRGPMEDNAIVKATAATTTSWVDEILPVNGITKGTVTNGTSFRGVTSPLSTPLEILNFICDQSDVEWLMHPDGSVDVRPSTTLFPAPTSTSARIITRDPGSTEGAIEGVEAVNLDRSRDAADVVGRVVVKHSRRQEEVKYVTASQTPAGVRWKNFAGGTAARSLRAEGLDLLGAEATEAANRLIARVAIDQKEALLSSRTFNVSAEVRPGDRVWVWDRDSGLVDTANQAIYRGQVINPIAMRVYSLTWPITTSYGVYARCDGGSTWIDLTPYVQFEDPTVTWEVTISGRKRNASPVSNGSVVIPKGRGLSAQLNQASFAWSITSARGEPTGSWTPSWSNIVIGSGGSRENNGAWEVANGLMTIETSWTLGNTGSVSGNPTLTLPSGWQLRRDQARTHPYGLARMTVGGTVWFGIVQSASATTLEVVLLRADGDNARERNISATQPGTWGAGDRMVLMVSGIKVQPS